MKRFKTILKIFFITILSLVLLGIGFTFLFGDKIEEIILSENYVFVTETYFDRKLFLDRNDFPRKLC